ncbi:hypothetical protein Pmani_008273 [Petrolisthes manimaculis]|uniref:Immunoglobulin V-set domain-containing protein n=2 Tax=Petrolisthes manimaculis TaxID=1843537 RepID=A0AAE1UJ55_9EUCA|nr:hypothetical protein Pmani_008273 [Petrolisthes manimaculis]
MCLPWVCLFVLTALGWESYALVVGPVQLGNNGTYITYGLGPSPQNSTLECPYQLQSTEEVVQKIEWVFQDDSQTVGTFEWQPEDEARATGRLDGAVKLNRTDGWLELTELRYDLAGYYSCALTLSNGRRMEAQKFEMLIIDTTSNHVYNKINSNEGLCELEASYSSYAVYPDPTVLAGMFSPSRGGFYDQVTGFQWHKQFYNNGSVAYSFEDVHFKIDSSTPTDAQFRVSASVLKEDATNLPLHSITSHLPIWKKQGCPALPRRQNQQVNYYYATLTCTGEYIPNFYSDEAKAVVRCAEGYHVKGQVDSIELVCSMETLNWSPESNSTLICG